MHNQDNWYEHFFDGIVLDFWEKAIPSSLTEQEVEFIKSKSRLAAGAAIVDVPCGFGRHSIPLAQQGYRVTAIDISPAYIARLSEKALHHRVQVDAICADIVTYSFDRHFDLAICFGNSLHYFDYTKMLAFISKIYEALNDEGVFIVNAGVVAEGLLPSLKERNWMEVGDILYLNHNTYLPEEGVLQTDYRFVRNGISETKTAYHYVMTLAETLRAFRQGGFRRLDVFGGLDSRPFKWGDPQAYIVAFK